MAKLSQVPVRAHLTGIIRLYKKKVDQSLGSYFNPEIIFRKVSTSDKLKFKELIKEMYTDIPMGYFQYPKFETVFPLHLQLENLSSYFADYFSGSDPSKEAYVGYIEDKPVTCFAIDISDPRVTACHFAGVIQEYRAKNVFRDTIRCLTALTYARGGRQLIAGARLENVSSQYGMAKEIGICYGHEWVYMLDFDK
jgi:hypothetical protein